MRSVIFALFVVIFIAVGCNSGTNNEPEPVDFALNIPFDAPATIPNSPVLVLVKAEDLTAVSAISGPVEITAACPNAVVTVEHAAPASGEYAELLITPTGDPVGEWNPGGMYMPDSCVLPLTISGTRDGLERTASTEITLYNVTGWDGAADPGSVAVLEIIVGWLAAEHPEMGITAATEWSAMPPCPAFGPGPHPGLTTYCFCSAEWQIGISWIGNWASFSLRERFVESESQQSLVCEDTTANPVVFIPGA